MYEFSVPMALTDYIPVIFFGIAAVLMQRDFYSKMPKYAFACFAAGCVNVFLAGFLKATWKLLYALNVCDFHVLNTMFVAPPLFAGTFVFIAMMVAGLGAMCASLSVVAAKMKKKGLIVVFVLTFLCYMAMGYLASRDGSSAAMNWIEQGVNTLGQALLLFGVVKLHRAGAREFCLEK